MSQRSTISYFLESIILSILGLSGAFFSATILAVSLLDSHFF